MLLTACVGLREAIVVNPCEHGLTVRLSNVVPAEAPPDEWNVEVSVPELSILRVEDAFFDQGEEANAVNGYSAEVEGTSGETRFLAVPASVEAPVPVIVPAAYCDLVE